MTNQITRRITQAQNAEFIVADLDDARNLILEAERKIASAMGRILSIEQDAELHLSSLRAIGGALSLARSATAVDASNWDGTAQVRKAKLAD